MLKTRQRELLTEAEFLAWAEPLEERFKLLEGVAVTQAGASRDHERVAKAVFASLYAQVDATLFDVNKGDFGVRVADGTGRGSVLYPEVVVDRQSNDGDERVTTTAMVVVEVLSPSTDLDHHIRKFHRYARIASLTTYLVFEQKAPVVRLWRRHTESWSSTPSIIEGMAQDIALPEIGAAIRLSEIYRKP